MMETIILILEYMVSSKGQRGKECDVSNCTEHGRILAKLGTIDIAYCPRHRKKYGERIINALINSRFNYKLSNFLSVFKKDIFMNDEMFCDECGNKLKSYIISKTEELENILEFQEENDAKFEVDLK